MKSSLLLGIAITAGLASAPLMAQRTVESVNPNLPNTVPSEAASTTVIGAPEHGAASMPVPMTLRNGAVWTGLSGYYDYQSNGMLRGRLMIPQSDPQKVYAVYMLSLNGTDETTIDPSRRIGFTYSTDGGATWEATQEIDPNFRLGYPYLDVAEDGTPYIAAHGDPTGEGVRTLMYSGTAGSTEFTRTGTFDRMSALGSAGDGGAGVIWPAFVIDPTNSAKGVVISTLSYAVGQQPEPIHFAHPDLGSSGPWDIIAAMNSATSSGGRNVMMTSPEGKVGIVYYHFDDEGNSGIYLSESTDGGTSWSTPEQIIPRLNHPNEEDSLFIGANIDFVYQGEEPYVVATGNIEGLFASQSIYFWSRTQGLKKIAGADSTMGIGAMRAQLTKLQSNMDFVSYPTLSLGDDGKHVVVTFQAAASQLEDDASVNIVNDGGFHFFRVWAVGSPDNGATWHTPRILQDFTGGDGEDATIEYALSNSWGHVQDNNFEHTMIFQAKRDPGMYASVIVDVSEDDGDQPSDRGEINEAFQFFQRTTLDPTFFGEPASVDDRAATGGMAIQRAFPNPARSIFNVDYQLPAAGRVTVKVFDALGAEVLAPVDEMQYVGDYSRNFSVAGLPAGQYRVVVTQNGRSVSHGMTIIR